MGFAYYANMLENVYGVQYDREELFVICPECGEPIYKCDWPRDTFDVSEAGEWYCPVCDEHYSFE